MSWSARRGSSRSTPGTAFFRVAIAEPPRVLVLRSATHVPPGWQRYGAAIDWTWCFALDRPAPQRTRVRLAYMTRQWLLRARGELQQEHPLIVAPLSEGVPFEAGKGYVSADVAEIPSGRPVAVAACALGLPAVALPAGIGDGLPHVRVVPVRR